METPEKTCPECGRDLRCTMTGANVYLAHTGNTHSADLFACFWCRTFQVFGLNMTPLKMWTDVDGTRAYVTPTPDVVVAGPVVINPYGEKFSFAHVEGEVIPLPSALEYMTKKCGHGEEINAYLEARGFRPHLDDGVREAPREPIDRMFEEAAAMGFKPVTAKQAEAMRQKLKGVSAEIHRRRR